MRTNLLLVGVLLLAGACGGDDEPAERATPTPTAEATTPAPPASAPPATTAPPASEEPVAGPTAGKASPAEAAQAFYADWGELDRLSASGYATQEVIDEAFAQQRAEAEFVDCLEEGDHFSCFYYYEGGGLGITVHDADAYGYIVTDVNYVAD
jgi:hypothetical protein